MGKRLRSSSLVLLNSELFQKYYRKASEARKVHMEKNFFANSMEALKSVAQVPGFLSMLPPISDPAEKVAVALPVLDSTGVAVFVKDMGKASSPMRGFLRQAFLNPSPVVQVTSVVKESPLSMGSHTAIKRSDFRVNGLTQSQKWSIGFGLSGEVVAWKQGGEVWDGEDGDSHYPLDVLPPDLALDWELDSNEDMDPSLAILEAIEEDFHRRVKAACLKTKGKKEVLNLVSSINYSDIRASSRLRKGKANMM